MNSKTVLSLCDRTGTMVRPWHRAGFRCVCVDIQHPAGVTEVEPGLFFVGADLLWWLPELTEYQIVFGFPPCTHLAVSGARWFKHKGIRRLAEGIELVERCKLICEWSGAPYAIENPVGIIESFWRRPDYYFHPWQYAGYLPDVETDNTTKKTCLWTGNGFIMPFTRPAPEPHRNDCHRAPPLRRSRRRPQCDSGRVCTSSL